MRAELGRDKEVRIIKLDSGFHVLVNPDGLDKLERHAFETFESLSNFLEKELE